MGKDGVKRTEVAREAAHDLVARLAVLGDIRARGMFGGYGIFGGPDMFALVNSAGRVHFRVDADSRGEYEEAGSTQHGKMPYFTVPEEILADDEALLGWADEALEVAREAKRHTPGSVRGSR